MPQVGFRDFSDELLKDHAGRELTQCRERRRGVRRCSSIDEDMQPGFAIENSYYASGLGPLRFDVRWILKKSCMTLSNLAEASVVCLLIYAGLGF